MQIIIKLPSYLILALLLTEDNKPRTFIFNSNNILLDLRDLKANLSSLVSLSLEVLKLAGLKMSIFTLFRNTSTSGKWILEGTIGNLLEWLEIDNLLYAGCLQHFFHGSKWHDGFSFEIFPSHQSPFAS